MIKITITEDNGDQKTLEFGSGCYNEKKEPEDKPMTKEDAKKLHQDVEDLSMKLHVLFMSALNEDDLVNLMALIELPIRYSLMKNIEKKDFDEIFEQTYIKLSKSYKAYVKIRDSGELSKDQLNSVIDEFKEVLKDILKV